jgi:membrane protease subunit HflC
MKSNRLFAIGGVVFFLLFGSIFIVRQHEQAIILSFGNPVGEVITEPGLHLKMPFFLNDVLVFDKRILDFDAESKTVYDKDQKPIIIDTFAKYKITNPLLFYQSAKTERRLDQLLDRVVESRLRELLGRIPFSQLLTNERNAFMLSLKNAVANEAKGLGIEIVDVRIKRADLPTKNTNAIFERMIAEREKEAKEFRAQGAEEAKKITSTADKERSILIAEANKKSEITRGEGDAEAIKIYASSFSKDAEFFAFWKSMQAYRQALSKDDTSIILSPDGEFMKYFGR